jgi:hypothetical protein
MPAPTTLAPLVVLVRSLDADLYRAVEVADALGTSTSTLRRLGTTNWHGLGPSVVQELRGVQVWLYDMHRVEAIAAHLARHKTRRGRPRLWDGDQRRLRRTRHCAASYRRRRARELTAAHDHGGAMAARLAAQTVAVALESMVPAAYGSWR